jgi:hypothetical protein
MGGDKYKAEVVTVGLAVDRAQIATVAVERLRARALVHALQQQRVQFFELLFWVLKNHDVRSTLTHMGPCTWSDNLL